MKTSLTLIAAALVVIIAGPAYSASTAICSNPPAGMVVHCVNPHDTSADLPSSDRLNFVMFKSGSPRGSKLFLWASGTETHQRPGPVGAKVKPMVVAAENGFRAVSVPYDNQTAIVAVCRSDPDPLCSEKERRRRADVPRSGVRVRRNLRR
ncbi:MAG: hypothetical protein WCJ64_25630, partial [Rhodospirillaceae bacterium]